MGRGTVGFSDTFTQDNGSFVQKPLRASLTRKKSPIPLRRRLDETAQSLNDNQDRAIQLRPASNSSRQNYSAKKQSGSRKSLTAKNQTNESIESKKHIPINMRKAQKQSHKNLQDFEKYLAKKQGPNKENSLQPAGELE